MRSCHLENLAPFVTTHKNCGTHRGTHKNDEARVCICILGRKTLGQNWKCSFIRQQGDHKKLNCSLCRQITWIYWLITALGSHPRDCTMQKDNILKGAVLRYPIFFPSFLCLFWHCHLIVCIVWSWVCDKENNLHLLSGNILDGMIPNVTESLDSVQNNSTGHPRRQFKARAILATPFPMLISISVSIFGLDT